MLTVPPSASNAAAAAGDLDALFPALAKGESVAFVAPADAALGGGAAAEAYALKPSAGHAVPGYGARRLEPASEAGPPRKCPCCEKQYPASAKICVECGIDLKTGRALLTTDETSLDAAYEIAGRIVQVISWVFFCGV